MTSTTTDRNVPDISRIAGNASHDIKQFLAGSVLTKHDQKERSQTFAESIQRRLQVTEVSINKKAEEEKKLEARVVLELEVSEGTPDNCIVVQIFSCDQVFTEE